MFTTRSRSGNSKRCGVSASRNLGPMSSSVLMIVNTLSMTSRNSSAEWKGVMRGNLAPAAVRPPRRGERARSEERRPALDEVRVQRVLDGLAHALGQLEHEPPVVDRVRSIGGGLDRLAELDPPLRRKRHE